jgi:acyl dehydratase
MTGPEVYLDDLSVGQRFTTESYELDEAEIVAFADRFDPQPFHLDSEAARTTLFGGLVASGWHTAAITMRLLVTGDTRIAGGFVGLGADVSWPTPARPGDVLTAETEVVDIIASRSRPDRGTATLRTETRNQRGEVVQVLTARVLVPRRIGG